MYAIRSYYVPSKLMINISNNAHSLRKSIYFSYLFETIGEDEILMFMENYMFANMQGENSYKDFLYLLEVPLLKARITSYNVCYTKLLRFSSSNSYSFFN